jgi:predicted DNA-binding protein
MPTHKKYINITLPDDTAVFLQKISQHDNVPQATKAVELLEFALEMEEDEYFSILAEKRDTPDARFISHEECWSQVL